MMLEIALEVAVPLLFTREERERICEEMRNHQEKKKNNLALSWVLAVANLMAWCSGPRGCASTRDVLLLDAVRLCTGVPARSTVRRDGDEVRVEDG
ncbi:unnamed protein product [Prunus armeniaca]